MNRILFLLMIIPGVMFSQSKEFKIEGKLTGYPDGTLIRLIKNGENTDFVSAKLNHEEFVLKGKLAEPTFCFLLIGDEQRPAQFFVENAKITFNGNKANPGVFEISGSTSHNDFTQFLNGFMPLAQELSALAGTINSTMPGTTRDSLLGAYNKVQDEVQNTIDQQVSEKPKSIVSAFILSATYNFNEDVTLLEKRFNKLDASVRKSELGKKLEDDIAQKKIGAIGTLAIDFTQPDTTGKPVSLSSFRGKYVLVDFWASWCGPCRQENPTVVENYNKFSSKNFTVLGVSLDRPGQKDKWLEAIKKDNLTWTHVSDLQFWNNAAAKLYNIQGIPQNILVGPDGVILAKNLRGPALGAKLCEILGCN
jgi:peroxiredoxin